MCGFIAQLVELRTGIAGVMTSNPVEAMIFFFRLLLSNCLNWKIYCVITLHFHISPFSNRIKPKIFETLSDATESNAQRNKLSPQATTSSSISHFRKTHLKRREVVMESVWKEWGHSVFFKSSF